MHITVVPVPSLLIKLFTMYSKQLLIVKAQIHEITAEKPKTKKNVDPKETKSRV